MIKIPKKPVNLKKFFSDLGLNIINNAVVSKTKKPQKDQRLMKSPYPPDLLDLYYLYEIIRLNKRITILEYGSGWSTLILYKALLNLKSKYKNKSYFRCNDPYTLFTVDDQQYYLNITKNRIKKNIKDLKNINFHYSPAEMFLINGKYCSRYTRHPQVNPDFIYIDGPDQFKIRKKINNFTINHKAMMPMLGDVLRYEHFLTPGTIILTDGRVSNYRYLINNLQRNWKTMTIKQSGQNILYLDEKPLGQINREQLKFYKSKY